MLFASGFSQAQKVKYPTQKGFVRTIGRYYDTKEVTSIYRIKDVGIYMSEGIGSKSDANGEFSLKPTKNEFTLSKVEKKGFKLISPSSLPKIFYCNPNDLEIVMADMNEELRFRRDTEKKIEIALRKEYDQKILELDSLYKQSKISQEQWKRKYNEIIQRQEKDREMVKKIAEEYSEIDFAKMDEIKKKIAELIINGKLKEARELMYKNGYVPTQIDDWKDKDIIIKDRRKELELQLKELEDAEKALEKEKDDLSYYCAEFARSFEIEHAHDSALFYLKKRCELDTLNTIWIGEVAEYYYKYIGNYEEALKWYTKAIFIQNQLSEPSVLELVELYNNIGLVYLEKGDADKALKNVKKALSIQKQSPELLNTKLTRLNNSMGYIYLVKSLPDKAIKWFKKALDTQKQVLDSLNIDLVVIYNNIGGVYDEKGEFKEALRWYDKSIKICEQVLDSLNPYLATLYNNIGGVYADNGDMDNALKFYTKSLTIREKVLDLSHPDLGILYNNMGTIYQNKADLDKALILYKKACFILEATLDTLSPRLAGLFDNIGTIYDERGNFTEALKWYNKSLKIYEQILTPLDPRLASLYSDIGLVNYLKGELDESLKWYNKALTIQEQVSKPLSSDLAVLYFYIGYSYAYKMEYDKALLYLKKSLPGIVKLNGENNEEVILLRQLIKELEKELGK